MVLSEVVSGLSNLFRWRDDPRSTAVIRPVRGEEIFDALALLLGSRSHPAPPAAVREFIDFAHHHGIDLSTMQTAWSESRLWAVCLPVPNPGQTVLMMTSPSGGSCVLADLIVRCVDQACQRIFSSEQPIVQILLELSDLQTAQGLRDRSFSDLATLMYLQKAVPRSFQEPSLPLGCDLLCYSPETHAGFARGILDSYEQSLDCPVLHGKRHIDDIIRGHKASGDFDPQLWFCLRDRNHEAGVLLLAPLHQHSMMEIVYIGLAPQARGKGYGDYLLKLALHHTANRRLKHLALAVDSMNTPAIRLYYRHGFQQVHQRLAMIRFPPG
ncbi:MAG: hypothetical protein KatS3mg104_0384 [Phycisphaerae bacterium]|jgi:ribosomal protein S18 acetylase RimI-like enzyme|nr:MAG: hypothetical protein KatS3mg104_0384 [Phycisphaerae bacterium]